jgi:DNA polymerase-1
MKKFLIKSKEDLDKFLTHFNKVRFAFDTETNSLNYKDQRLEWVSLCDGELACAIKYSPNMRRVLQNLFTEASVIVGWNIVFDVKALETEDITSEEPLWFDAMVAYHLVDENDEKGLKHCALKLLGTEMTSYEDAIRLPEKGFAKYAMDDAIATWHLAQLLKDSISEERVNNLFYEIEMPFLKTLASMEINGVLIDKDKLSKTTLEVEEAVTNLEVELHQLIGEPYQLQTNLVDGKMRVISKLNLNSGVQLGEILFNKLKLKSVGKTESGKDKTGVEAMNSLKGQHPFVDTLIKYKIAQKLLNAFLIPMPSFIDEYGRIHPNFKDVGTVTGRLSCRDPNLQQLPKSKEDFPVDVRGFFIPSKGCKMISIDYSQQEIRIMTHLSKDDTLIKIINEDGDLHLINANNVFNLGIPQEELFAGHPNFESHKKKFKAMRDKGKIFSFGIAYGMGAHKLSRDFKVSMDEAEKLLDNFFKGFPKLKKAIDKTHYEAESELKVTTMFGRKRRFSRNEWGKLDNKALRQSFNFLIQSTGADLIRLASNKLYQYSKDYPERKVKLLMTIHDEIVIECKQEFAEVVAKDAEKLFESCANLIVPLKAESSIGVSYGDCK